MTTLNKISSQVREIYLRSFDPKDRNRKLDDREVNELVIQTANGILGLMPVQTKGFRIDDFPALMIATYTAQTVNEANGVYTVDLPVYPVSLPRDMGVWEVIGTGKTIPFIPVSNAMHAVVGDIEEIGLEGQVGWKVEGLKIVFTANPVVSTVTVKQLVLDPAKFGGTDVLPVTAEMEIQIITEVLKLLGISSPQPEQPEVIIQDNE